MQQLGAVVKDVKQALEQVKREAAGMGINLMRGRLIGVDDFEGGFPRIAWKAGEDNDWREFLVFAKSLGIKAMVYDYDTLSIRDLEEDAEWLQDVDYPDSSLYLSKTINELRPHDGEIGHIGLSFQYDVMTYQASIKAPWFDSFLEAQMMSTSFDEYDEGGSDMYDIQ